MIFKYNHIKSILSLTFLLLAGNVLALSPGGILYDSIDATPAVGHYIENRHHRCAEKYAKKAKNEELNYYKAANALKERPGGVRKKMLEMKMSSAEKKYIKYRDKSNVCARNAVKERIKKEDKL